MLFNRIYGIFNYRKIIQGDLCNCKMDFKIPYAICKAFRATFLIPSQGGDSKQILENSSREGEKVWLTYILNDFFTKKFSQIIQSFKVIAQKIKSQGTA